MKSLSLTTVPRVFHSGGPLSPQSSGAGATLRSLETERNATGCSSQRYAARPRLRIPLCPEDGRRLSRICREGRQKAHARGIQRRMQSRKRKSNSNRGGRGHPSRSASTKELSPGSNGLLAGSTRTRLAAQAESAWQRHGERQGWLLLAAPALHRRRRNQSRQLDFAANQANLDSSKAQGLSSSAQSSRRLIYGDCRRPSTTEGLWPDMAALYS